ncbi:MAG TPA: hypothetical protein EYP17_08680 [Candidatus Latescibacteria bacterium]|nr:hypothetical protein [Candidatus Latescibacterota bacterium]
MAKHIRVERIFCTDMCMLSPDDEVISRTRKAIKVGDRQIEGWIVELKISSEEEFMPAAYSPDTEE